MISVGRCALAGGTAILAATLTLSGVRLRAIPVQNRVTASASVAIGSRGCAGSACHTSENRWLTSQPGGREHRSSFAKLRQSPVTANRYARAVGLSSFDEPTGMCVDCHGVNVAATNSVEGVGCESCHGPARSYLTLHTKTPADYLGAVRRGMRNLRRQPDAWIAVCRDCHVLDDHKYERLLAAGHSDGARWNVAQKFAGVQTHWTNVRYSEVTIARADPGVIIPDSGSVPPSASRPPRARPGSTAPSAPRPPRPPPGAPASPPASPPPAGAPPVTGGTAPPRPSGEAPPVTVTPADNQLPDFPWPPPAPSAQAVLPNSLFETTGRPRPVLASIGAALVNALERARYFEYSYYRAPNGFALVARLERIDAEGTPMPEEFRFLLPGSKEPFSLAAYVKRLFFAPEGLYRQIVFAVTDQPFVATGAQLDAAGAARLLSKGANRLSSDFNSLPFTDDHRVSALIYEFRKGAKEGDVSTLVPGRLGARTHLEKAGIYQTLVGR